MKIDNYISMATLSISGSFTEKLQAISAAGFRGIEIGENDITSSMIHPCDIGDVIADFGLKPLLFQPFRDFEGACRDQISGRLEHAKRNFDLMNKVGVDTLLLCSNVSSEMIKDDEVIIEDLRLLAECADKFGVKIGYEALSWGNHVSSYSHAWDLVKKVDHKALGIILDSFHILALGESISGLDMIDPAKIFFVQLADAPKLQIDIIECSRHFRCYPGNGDLAVTPFVNKLIEIGYDGPLSLEIFSDDIRSLSPRVAAFEGMLSMKYLKDNIESNNIFCGK